MRTIFVNRTALYIGAILIAITGLVVHLQNRMTRGSSHVCERTSAGGTAAGSAREICFERYLVSVAKKKGIDAALDEIGELYKKSPFFTESCHGYVHKIGEEAYYQFQKNKNIPLTSKTAYCGFGFYHGFMEILVGKTKNEAGARVFCDTVGNKLDTEISSTRISCYHGIGHGVADPHDPGLYGKAEEMAKRAIGICERVASNNPQGEEAQSCAGGVYNEMTQAYYQRLRGLSLDFEDPFAFCRTQDNPYQSICYYEFGMLLRQATREDIGKAFGIVSRIDNALHADAATRALGSILPSDISKFRLDSALMHCRNLTAPLHSACIRGLATGFMQHGQPTIEYKETMRLCDSPKLSTEERDTCFSQFVSDLRAMYDREKVTDICRALDDRYRNTCT